MLDSQQCTFWTLVVETSLFVDNAWLCLKLDHGAAHLGYRSFVHRDANNTETVLFTTFSLSCCMGGKCIMTWPMAQEANRCTFRTSCIGVSWKRTFLWILRNFRYSCLTVMRMDKFCTQFMPYSTSAWIHIRKAKHTPNSTVSVLRVFFGYLSARDILLTKGDKIVRELPLCTCFMDTTVHETELCTFCTIQAFVSGNLCFPFITWICT